MITLKKHKANVEICKLKTGKKLIPVYWNPIRTPSLRLAVTDIKSFDNEHFRDQFRLSQNQSDEIISHLKANTTPENHLQSVFFKVKRFVEESLYTQMILTDNEKQELVVNFPEGNDNWPGVTLLCGASNCGKTWTFCEKIRRNLDGPLKNRRNFIIVSNEWNKDCTLSNLKSEKYRPWITGIDISDNSLRNSLHATPEEFYKNEVQGAIDYAEPGSCICIDDPMDACCASILRRRINRMCRCSRHDKVGLMFILHKIASGTWSSTASSNCKWFILYPRSQRGKVRDWLNKEMGCTLAEARDHVFNFSQAGRAMHVRLFSPQCLITKNRLQLL